MYHILDTIQQTSYETAQQRGKDVSCIGCLTDMGKELAEYWAAVEAGRNTDYAKVYAATEITNDAEFAAYFEANLHNTVTDEMADLLIVAATWMYAAKHDSNDENFNAEKSYDVYLASSAVLFLSHRMYTPDDAEALREMVNLKLRYNHLRSN